jgi:enamine deaminase RidA (YjgF/YER057c/UK114 family)
MSTHRLLNPKTLPPPRGFNHGVAIKGGTFLFVAGQIGCNEKGILVSGDVVDQFEKALLNILEVVKEAGGTPTSIARFTIYVTDLVEYRARLKGLGEAYRRVMGKHYPAMALVEVKSLFQPNSRIELEATAVL